VVGAELTGKRKIMSKIVYGSKYAMADKLSAAEIAKLVRADIKAAVKSGELPKAKYSVRKESYAGGRSINVSISCIEKPGFRYYNPERLRADVERPHEHCGIPYRSEEAQALIDQVEKLVNAYNFDGSDIMTDYFHVNFYASVEISDYDRDAEIALLKAA
jgi:hypothetical protein